MRIILSYVGAFFLAYIPATLFAFMLVVLNLGEFAGGWAGGCAFVFLWTVFRDLLSKDK